MDGELALEQNIVFNSAGNVVTMENGMERVTILYATPPLPSESATATTFLTLPCARNLPCELPTGG